MESAGSLWSVLSATINPQLRPTPPSRTRPTRSRTTASPHRHSTLPTADALNKEKTTHDSGRHSAVVADLRPQCTSSPPTPGSLLRCLFSFFRLLLVVFFISYFCLHAYPLHPQRIHCTPILPCTQCPRVHLTLCRGRTRSHLLLLLPSA